MSVFRYREDRVYVMAFTLLLCVDIAIYLNVTHPLLLLLWFGVGILPKACVCAFNHHHQHVPVFRAALLNRALEIMYALHTGITSHAWVLHHSLGHHVTYLDQRKDESRWQRQDGTTMGEMEYSWSVALTAYQRAWAVGKRYPRARATFAWMGALTLSVVVGLVWLRPLAGLFVFVLAPAFSLWGTAWATYAHHAGRGTQSHAVASNNMLQPFYNRCTGNLGFHTAHHTVPGLHWSRLPQLHETLRADIPADAYIPPGWPWRLAGDTPSVVDVDIAVSADIKRAA